jgi:UDP-galactopyranose mutase
LIQRRPALLVVGAGFFGLTIADKVARTLGLPVHVIDSREHIGGNAFSYKEESTGIEVHKYGSHLFHTSHEEVWRYVNSFSDFNGYRHSVVSLHDGKYYPMPINLQTISSLFGKAMSPSEAALAIKMDVEAHLETFAFEENTFEGRALSTIGPTLYKALVHGYTLKQWQTDPANLPASVFSRLPVRLNHSNGYFTDTWEGLPLDGYSTLFDRMADDSHITVELGTDYFKSHWQEDFDMPVVFTGPIDKYFKYRHGRLSWRTLDFETEVLEVDDFQGTSVVNYPDQDSQFTRIHEYKHLHPERNHPRGRTVIAKEYSRWAEGDDEPYYPVNSPADREKLKAYRGDAAKLGNVYFGGRLGTYQYLDMHMAIASALVMFETQLKPRLKPN